MEGGGLPDGAAPQLPPQWRAGINPRRTTIVQSSPTITPEPQWRAEINPGRTMPLSCGKSSPKWAAMEGRD